MDNPQKYKNKFDKLFDLLKPSHEIGQYYSENVIGILSTDIGIHKDLIASPFLSDLLLKSFLNAEQCTLSVRTFLVRLTAVIVNNELQFTKMCFLGGLKMIKIIADVSSPHLPSCIRIAFVELADNLTQHTSGLTWLLHSDIWKHIFNMCYQKQTVYVKQHSYQFLSNLVWRSSEMDDEKYSIPVLEYLLKPLLESQYHTAQEISREDEQSWSVLMEPTIEVFYRVLADEHKINRPSKLVQLLIEHFFIERNIQSIVTLTHIPHFAIRLSILYNIVCYAKLVHTKPTEGRTNDDYVQQLVNYLTSINGLIMKRMTKPVLDYVTITYSLWLKIGKDNVPETFSRYSRTFGIQNQFVCLALVPALCYVHSRRITTRVWSEFLDGFFNHLGSETCEYTIRTCYMYRDLINEENKLTKMVIDSLKQLFTFKNDLSPQQVGFMLRALFYLLDCYLGEDLDADKNIIISVTPLTLEDIQIIVLTVDVIHMVLKHYEIEWHECFELTCLYNKITNILKAHIMPDKFVVNSLDVITLAMRNFLHPNLALLFNSQDMSALDEVGELIYVYLHDGRWEVRDSAVQLLLECLDIARRYTPMQQSIMSNKLIATVANLAFNDTEFYVQASSIKCLIATTKIRTLWETLLDQNAGLYQQLLSVLQNSTEAIVRKEATNIWKDILEQGNKLPPDITNKLYCLMHSAASSDLHWEVQLASLAFWRRVIDNRLTHYGMLDGSFPPVTFSKEQRKIIHLTNSAIQKCLIKILQELATTGCLKALCDTLTEDSHVQVLQLSLNIARDLMKIISQYNVANCPETESTTVNVQCNQTSFKSSFSSSNISETKEVVSRDTVINSILGMHDLELLAEHESPLRISEHVEPCSHSHYIPPRDFLNALTARDYDEIIKSKKEWNAGTVTLHSLLDEMLN